MDINKDIILFIADNREKQLKIKNDFQDLFLQVFQKSLDDIQWEHFYLNCPYGQAVSFAYYHKNIMIAHGGLIPQQLISKGGSTVDYFLQTAVMVSKEFQNLALFKNLMDNMGRYTEECGRFSLAFPNKNTFMPFVKMLGWNPVREYSIIQYKVVDRDDTCLTSGQGPEYETFEYDLDLGSKFVLWRGELNKLFESANDEYKIFFKDHEGSLEVMYASLCRKGGFIPISKIAAESGFQSVNLPECYLGIISLENLQREKEVGIAQKMCFYPFQVNNLSYESIKPSLLLSDVF